MTEKRFTLMSVVNFDYGINDNDEPIGSLSNICDLLNDLNDENEQLKEAVWSWSHSYKRVYEENEQLKHRIKKLQNELNNCEEDYVLEEYL